MKTGKYIFLSLCMLVMTFGLQAQDYPSGKMLLAKVTENIASETRIVSSTMEINGARNKRVIETKTWSRGREKAYVEILSPEKDKGTKMLKLGNKLWIYSPKTKRSIEISGQMLRQSMLGSDMSYDDLMDDNRLLEKYTASVTGHEIIDGRKCWIVTLTAIQSNVNYFTQKMWVDAERYVPLKIDLFARSGKLLKRLEFSDVERIQGRWFPKTFVYKDMLKEGKNTKMTVSSIQFDVDIPESVFEKSRLK